MTRLLLIRHGETDWNRDRRVQGATDIPLNETGRAQAREAAATVAGILGTDAAFLASSDLVRAAETARIIGAELSIPGPWTTPLLRERGYGEGEGLDLDEFRSRYGLHPHAQPPGAETLEALRTRALSGLRAAADATPAGAVLVAVAHGGLIREVLGHASDGAVPAPGQRIPNASVQELVLEGDRLRLVSHVAAA